MTRKQYLLMTLLALVSGLIGGALSSHIIQPVFAEKTQKTHEKIIRAGRFELVDESGDIHAILMLDEGDPYLYMCERPMIRKYRKNANYAVNLATRRNTSISYNGIEIYDPDGYRSSVSSKVLCTWGPGDEVGVAIASIFPGPHISLFQNGHARSTMGCTDLMTKKAGTKTTRSAASLVLFDEKGDVIWSTPE